MLLLNRMLLIQPMSQGLVCLAPETCLGAPEPLEHSGKLHTNSLDSASVSARFIFFRVFEGTKHKTSHTVIGWVSWAGILGATWLGAFIIAEVIPFFSDLLSLMSSLFDSFFGFIFWGVAYIRMRRVDGGVNWLHEQSLYGYVMLAFNVTIILIGLFFLGAGTYTSVQSIIDSYAAHTVGGVFTCTSNGI